MLQQPKSSGSRYPNYKGTDGVILLTMVGPEYEFLFVDVGMNGRNSDGGNWSQPRLKNGFEKNTLNLPDPTPLPGRNDPLPYVCMGDDGFPLTAYMMKHYPKEPEFREAHIQLPTFKNETHIRKRIWHPPKSQENHGSHYLTQENLEIILQMRVVFPGNGNAPELIFKQ